MTLMTLQLARSKVIKQWRDTDRKITFCYNEARDNAKFIQSMEKCCHSLYLHDPVSHLTYLQFVLYHWFQENMFLFL
jgi:dynein heavy chain